MILEDPREEGSKSAAECCRAGKSSFFNENIERAAKVGKCGFGASLKD